VKFPTHVVRAIGKDWPEWLLAYLAAMKNIKQDVSIHVWFDYDVTAFRFVLRVGGQPWTDAVVTGNQATTNTRGFFVTLAPR